MQRAFQLIDVFGAMPFSGNPLAVVLDAEGLTTEEMQQITRWMNLSETAFVLHPSDPGADYRVRIFTLARELPFAGHPTLGSCHAWLEAGGKPRDAGSIVQQCGVGLIPIRRGPDALAFAAPTLQRSGPVDAAFVDELARILGIEPDEIVDSQWVDNGPGWVGVLLGDAETVLRIDPDFTRSSRGGSLDIGLVGPYPAGSECAFEVRAIFSDERRAMREDPVTGSLNASLGQWLLGTGRASAPYVTSQGTRLGRTGRPRIEQDPDGQVWVGGKTATLVVGQLMPVRAE